MRKRNAQDTDQVEADHRQHENHNHQRDVAVLVEFLQRLVRKKVADHLAGIERRQRNDVEYRQQYVDLDRAQEQIDQRLPNHVSTDGRDRPGGRAANDHDDSHHGEKGRQQIGDWPGNGTQNIVANHVLEVPALDRHGLAPAKRPPAKDDQDQRHQNRSNRVDVHDGIQRNPSHHLARRVTQSIRHPGACRLAYTDREQQHDDLEEDVDWILVGKHWVLPSILTRQKRRNGS